MTGLVNTILAASNSAPPPPTASSVLLHFEGSDGSTTFTDDGSLGLTDWAQTSGGGSGAGATISTAQFKFGSSSLLIPDEYSFISAAVSSGLNFLTTTEDFIFDFWFYPTSPFPAYYEAWLGVFNGATSITFQAYDPGSGSVALYDPTTGRVSVTNPIIANEWNYIEISRTTGVDPQRGTYGEWWYCYANGTLGTGPGYGMWDATGSGSAMANPIPATTTISVGGIPFGVNQAGPGYLDEFHIAIGPGVGHTSVSYTPPTGPYTS